MVPTEPRPQPNMCPYKACFEPFEVLYLFLSLWGTGREGTLAREMSSPLKMASKTLSHSHFTHVELS